MSNLIINFKKKMPQLDSRCKVSLDHPIPFIHCGLIYWQYLILTASIFACYECCLLFTCLFFYIFRLPLEDWHSFKKKIKMESFIQNMPQLYIIWSNCYYFHAQSFISKNQLSRMHLSPNILSKWFFTVYSDSIPIIFFIRNILLWFK